MREDQVTLPYLCSKVRLEAFVDFMRLLKKAPNTIANHCKSFSELYKWMNLKIELKPLRDWTTICDRYVH